jgi:pyridoxamine 5'-phosphate oxidase family protein
MTLSEAEQRFLVAQDHGRLATIARDGTPQVKPVGFSYNPRLGTIDIAGMNMARSAKYKNVQANPRAPPGAFVPSSARFSR